MWGRQAIGGALGGSKNGPPNMGNRGGEGRSKCDRNDCHRESLLSQSVHGDREEKRGFKKQTGRLPPANTAPGTTVSNELEKLAPLLSINGLEEGDRPEIAGVKEVSERKIARDRS